MVVTRWMRVRCLRYMRMGVAMHNTVARVTNGVAVDMGVSYERRWLEASLYRG
jgi:hypothetical protein